jgi:DNA-binding PadR family transcriptional regulator
MLSDELEEDGMRHHHRHHDDWAPAAARRRGRRGGGFGAAGGQRARRGDVRSAILVLLRERPMHGYQMIQELAERTDGEWHPSPGSVYPRLQLLEESGLITGTEVEGKRIFTLTSEGERVVDERGDQAPPWASMAGASRGPFRDLKEAFPQLAAAAMQVVKTGTAEQAEATIQILVEARRKIYSLLAEDTTA